jgi:hypothetical protein
MSEERSPFIDYSSTIPYSFIIIIIITLIIGILIISATVFASISSKFTGNDISKYSEENMRSITTR